MQNLIKNKILWSAIALLNLGVASMTVEAGQGSSKSAVPGYDMPGSIAPAPPVLPDHSPFPAPPVLPDHSPFSAPVYPVPSPASCPEGGAVFAALQARGVFTLEDLVKASNWVGPELNKITVDGLPMIIEQGVSVFNLNNLGSKIGKVEKATLFNIDKQREPRSSQENLCGYVCSDEHGVSIGRFMLMLLQGG